MKIATQNKSILGQNFKQKVPSVLKKTASMSYAAGPAGLEVRPYPRWFGAKHIYPSLDNLSM